MKLTDEQKERIRNILLSVERIARPGVRLDLESDLTRIVAIVEEGWNKGDVNSSMETESGIREKPRRIEPSELLDQGFGFQWGHGISLQNKINEIIDVLNEKQGL